MANFILLYKGTPTDMSQMTPEQQKAVMDEWGAWMGRVGGALKDVGAPFGPNGASIVDNGTEGKALPLNGYSIIEANDLAGAKKLCDGHPFLAEGKGNFAVEVYELMPVPM